MNKNKKIFLIVLNTALVIFSAVCLITIHSISENFPGQREYQVWKGDNEMDFSQVSCFISPSSKLTSTNINSFRNSMMDAFFNASLLDENDNKLFIDCWSTDGSCFISTDRANTTAPVTAVGGEYFEFHPYTFTDAVPFSENSTYNDCVILDEELAWFLFGSTEVVGETVKIDNQFFYIIGVVDREDDLASEKAYDGGMGLYMPYEAYTSLYELDAPITCYEVVIPNPVKNFAINLVNQKFPVKGCIINEVTNRFAYSRLLKIFFKSPSRAMSSSIPYPYWENALRLAESWCSQLAFYALVLLIYPAYSIIRFLFNTFRKAHVKVHDDYIPDIISKTEEAIRKKQRKRWEKNHPGQN